jgi:predicted phage replisome organizer
LADVKWIKITVNMFDDEKIRIIESMPDADAILVIWIKLLTLAGKTNTNGFIFLSENIPYTDEMLSTIFSRPLNTVRLALQTFKQFGMIDYDEKNFLYLVNWNKHQNVEGLEKIREQTRQRVAKHREKQKMLPESNVTLPVTQSNATEKNKNKKENKNKEIYIDPFKAYTNNPELLQTLNDFLKMRKVIKKEMTERAIKSLLNRLDKLAGTDQGKIAILEQSIISNWANIYELKDNKSTKSSGLFPHEKDLMEGGNS